MSSILMLMCWVVFAGFGEVFASTGYGDHLSLTFFMLCNALSILVSVLTTRLTNDALHPLAFFSLVNFIYATFYPFGASQETALFAMPPSDLTDGARIFAFATLGLCLVYFRIASRPPSTLLLPPVRPDPRIDRTMLVAGTIVAVFAFLLVSYFGVVIRGKEASYSDIINAAKDESLLGFAVMLPIASLALLLAGSARRTTLGKIGIGFALLGVAVVSLLLLKRSFTIRMILIFIVFYNYKIRRIRIPVYFGAMALGILVFVIAGYIRRFAGREMSFIDMLGSIKLQDLFDLSTPGEFKELYRCVINAAHGAVDALPYAGDYLLAWQFAIPKFLIGEGRMMPLNIRYALATIYEAAVGGVGLGFSMAAEGYIVFGFVGVTAVYVAAVSFFVWLYDSAKRNMFHGMSFFYFLVSFFSIAWMQRNSFAYFFKEPVLYFYFFGTMVVMIVRSMTIRTRRW